MHRAKHRAAGGVSAAVPAATLIERFALVPGPRPASSGPRHGGATLLASEVDGPSVGSSGLFGALPCTAPTLVVPDDDARAAMTPRSAAALFGGADDGSDDVLGDGTPRPGDGALFGAARHARSRGGATPVVPGPRVSSTAVRSQPVGTALSVTVLGAAAAVTAVVVPAPSAIETTGSMAPVHEAAPAPAPVPPIGPALTVPAPLALPEQPTVQIPDLVDGVRAQMQKAVPTVNAPYSTVANTTALGSSPAAMMRKAAMTNALGKLGRPYRWGAMGPNAFDCSGLVKWSFANAGRALPRTSRAMASVGVPVARRNLQPGDLVFFYQPISHVGIYIGNNKIVHASQSGQPVKVSDITYMRFTTARRIV
jgi:peptidoglycan DL-endopeptidase CwlO